MRSPLDEDGQPPPAINLERVLQRSMSELLGICKGVIVDGTATDTEIVALHEWLQRNARVAATWPASILSKRIMDALSDAIIDDAERADLQGLLQEIAGGEAELITVDNRATEVAFTDPAPTVIFDNHRFCLTGRFAYGPRVRCDRAITGRGGLVLAAVRKDLDYLIIGTFGSRDWLHSTHGTKIQKAVRYGCPIIGERSFIEALG